MSNVFTLDSLNDELNTRYGSFIFQAGNRKFELPPVLRLPETERKVAYQLLTSADEVQETGDLDKVTDLLAHLLQVIVRDGKGDALVQLLDRDLLKMQIVIEKWSEATQPGEA